MGYKINEIFYSIQGEGRHAGEAAIFIRFAGCNLRCPFCDTLHQQGEMMTLDAILQEVAKYDCTFIVLTGGEPSLFVDEYFVGRLHEKGYYVAMETNGTHAVPKTLDWVTLSPKDQFVQNAPLALDCCSELKVVYPCENIALYDEISAKYRYLQPCDEKDEEKNKANMSAVVEYVLQHPNWRISLQGQKILDVR